MNRSSYARSITRLLDRAENHYNVLPAFRTVYNPESVLAAKTDLEAISKQLASDEPVNAKGLAQLKELLADGVTSPLFRKDTAAAKRAVAEVRDELVAA